MRFTPAHADAQCRKPWMNIRFGHSVVVLSLICLPWLACVGAEIDDVITGFNTRSFDEKMATANALARLDHPRVIEILSALIEGKLYRNKASGHVVIAEKVEGGNFALRDAVSADGLGTVARGAVRKVSVNNSLRRKIRGLIASLQLNQADAKDRIAAIESIVAAGLDDFRTAIETRRTQETDPKVLESIDLALIVFDLDSPDQAARIAAIESLSANLSGNVRSKLSLIAENPDEEAPLRDAAKDSLRKIEIAVSRYAFFEMLFFGLSLGSVLALAAIGLSITFGVMGVINMAHGELIMIGAYTTYVVQLLLPDALEYSLLVAIPAAFLVSAAVGMVIERSVIRFLYGRPLETLLATFGVSLILQQGVRTIFSPLNRSVRTPEWMSGSFEIATGLSFTFNRLYILIFALVVFAALLFVLQRTRLGLEVRAVTQNRNMARAMGIRSARVDVLTFGLGAGIAGVAGVALSQLTNVGPNLGQAYIVDSFLVVVFGGVGNLWGTLVAGLSLGVMNKMLEPAVGTVVAKILILIFIILFIQKRPRGLFPQRGRAAED